MRFEWAIAAASAVLVIGTLAFAAVFVWPGPLTTSPCGIPGSGMSMNGRMYCSEVVPLPRLYGNYTIWGYLFELHTLTTPGGLIITVGVSEPSGASFTGAIAFIGPSPPNSTRSWFTPGEEAGVYMLFSAHDVTLLVENWV
jgi:hypothetical protein